MKNIIIILATLTISFASNGKMPIESIVQLEKSQNVNPIRATADKIYPVVAKTDRGGFVENYSIAANVYATEIYPGDYSISKVIVEGISVRYWGDPYNSNKYSFDYEGYTYYFTL